MKLVGKAAAINLWKVLISSIMDKYSDECGHHDILLVKMLDALEANDDNHDYIMKALTVGVKIRKHGSCPKFHAAVDRFAHIFESLRNE